ncbi:MAG: hypothetical protein Q8M17_12885 [Actinomycetota bacterium]|nr:hypothetical protein [Actinomycetota bacterium]
MHDTYLDAIIADPSLASPAAARALIELSRRVSPHDPDIAGDVVLLLTERLAPGGMIAARLASHANPGAMLQIAARNAAHQARRAAGTHKRAIPLTVDGDLLTVEPHPSPFSPTIGLLDLLHDLGWRTRHFEALVIPRRQPGRSIHPGIEAALDKLARCYGITVRCPGCPTPSELQRLDLTGPAAWPVLVPVLVEWGWSDEAIVFITTTASHIAPKPKIPVPPPPRQERRMIDIARRMRWDPDQLTDADTIRAAAQPRRPDHPTPQPTPQPVQQPVVAAARAAAAGLSPVGS